MARHRMCSSFILNLVLSMPHGNMVIFMKLHPINPLNISNQAQ